MSSHCVLAFTELLSSVLVSTRIGSSHAGGLSNSPGALSRIFDGKIPRIDGLLRFRFEEILLQQNLKRNASAHDDVLSVVNRWCDNLVQLDGIHNIGSADKYSAPDFEETVANQVRRARVSGNLSNTATMYGSDCKFAERFPSSR